jgi:hypothetical protein
MKRFPTKTCFDVKLLYSLSFRKYVQSPVTNEVSAVFVGHLRMSVARLYKV